MSIPTPAGPKGAVPTDENHYGEAMPLYLQQAPAAAGHVMARCKGVSLINLRLPYRLDSRLRDTRACVRREHLNRAALLL